MSSADVTEVIVDRFKATSDDIQALQAHYDRHRREHDAGPSFMPFTVGDSGPNVRDVESVAYGLDKPGWLRVWVARVDKSIIGHVDLRGGRLTSELHHATLGIGLETGYRGHGLGRRLMQQAIEFCQTSDSLVWLNLNVFAHNESGITLYEQLGFTRNGVYPDRFRLGEESIDDISMSLRVAPVR